MKYDEATRILNAYGLGNVLTDKDDPLLWAAILAKYWPLPHSPTIRIWGYQFEWKVSSLCFGVGVPKPNEPREIEVIDEWCFERVDASSLQITEFEHREVSFDNPWIGLIVTRPSKNQNHALVHLWTLHHGRAGHGVAYQWECSSNGDWTEVESVSEWMA
jgi:hypothetical protein